MQYVKSRELKVIMRPCRDALARDYRAMRVKNPSMARLLWKRVKPMTGLTDHEMRLLIAVAEAVAADTATPAMRAEIRTLIRRVALDNLRADTQEFPGG